MSGAFSWTLKSQQHSQRDGFLPFELIARWNRPYLVFQHHHQQLVFYRDGGRQFDLPAKSIGVHGRTFASGPERRRPVCGDLLLDEDSTVAKTDRRPAFL